MGIRAGDHVALSCPNVPWFPIAYFGILKAGAVVVPLNVLLKPREIAYHLKDSDAKAYPRVRGHAGAADRRRWRRRRAPRRAARTSSSCRAIRGAAAGEVSIARSCATPPAFHPPRREPHDTAVILYTSGTTGHAKGAELTHGNMVEQRRHVPRHVQAGVRRRHRRRTSRSITLPLFHSTAQTAQMNAGLLRRVPPGADAALRCRPPCSTRSRASRSVSGSACRRCTGRCCSMRARPGADVSGAAASLRVVRLGRRADAGRGAARVRGDVQRARARRLRAVGNGAGRRVQPAAAAVEARHGRPADLRRRHPLRRRARQPGAARASAAKSWSAART